MSDLNFSPSPTNDGVVPPRPQRRPSSPNLSEETAAPSFSTEDANASKTQPAPQTTDLRTEDEKALDEQKKRWREDAERHQAAARASATRATAMLDQTSLSVIDAEGEERIIDPRTPRWFVGEPEIYQKYQAQHGEEAFKKNHGPIAQLGYKVSLALAVAGLGVGAASVAVPALAAVGAFVVFSAAFPLLAVGLRNERIAKKMDAIVFRAGKASSGDQEATKVIDTLAGAVNATTAKAFEGLVARAAFKEKLSEMRKAGKSPSLAVRNTAAQHRIR